MSLRYIKGLLFLNGSRITSPAAFELLREAVPDIGQCELFDFATGQCRKNGKLDGASHKMENVEIDTVALAASIEALDEVKAEVARITEGQEADAAEADAVAKLTEKYGSLAQAVLSLSEAAEPKKVKAK